MSFSQIATLTSLKPSTVRTICLNIINTTTRLASNQDDRGITNRLESNDAEANRQTKEALQQVTGAHALKEWCGHSLIEKASLLKYNFPKARVNAAAVFKAFKTRKIRYKNIKIEHRMRDRK